MRSLATPAELEADIAALASAIAADMQQVKAWAIVGIRQGGVPLADELARRVANAVAHPPLRGDVDITLYRDDLYTGLEKPIVGDTDLPFEVNGCGIVLVDDVLFTGRTVRAAMGEVWDFGRPAFIRLCVLVDRGHRELPIAADYFAMRVETDRGDRVSVDWLQREVRLRPANQ